MFVCKARHLVLAGGSKVRISGLHTGKTRLVGTWGLVISAEFLGKVKGFFGTLIYIPVICHSFL
jgi:hypothetical protein